MEAVSPGTTPKKYSQPHDSVKPIDASGARRHGRRKYAFTDQIDQPIREFYLSLSDGKTRPGIHALANRVGIPHWALKKCARELGLARTKELPWSEPELELLARFAWMSDERPRLKLKAAGYTRTATATHLKLKRMSFKKGGGFYSANSLAQALGIDPHAVTRWIRAGRLKATLGRTARGERQNGDIYLIRERNVRRLALEHPSDVDLRKVNQLCFLDMLTNLAIQVVIWTREGGVKSKAIADCESSPFEELGAREILPPSGDVTIGTYAIGAIRSIVLMHGTHSAATLHICRKRPPS